MNKDEVARERAHKSLELVKEILHDDLLGVYLYGSSVVEGLQKYSDIDLFVVSKRATTSEEKAKLVVGLLEISEFKSLPVELTIVEKSQINPWRYPPKFDFQYGEWLRERFESGDIELWQTKEMPDLAILVTQILLASSTLFGQEPDKLLCKVPHKDLVAAMADALPSLMSELESDTRNVLLTIARIWNTLSRGIIHSKPTAATWAITQLPEVLTPPLKRAKLICLGEKDEYWDDIKHLIAPCAEHMLREIKREV